MLSGRGEEYRVRTRGQGAKFLKIRSQKGGKEMRVLCGRVCQGRNFVSVIEKAAIGMGRRCNNLLPL